MPFIELKNPETIGEDVILSNLTHYL